VHSVDTEKFNTLSNIPVDMLQRLARSPAINCPSDVDALWKQVGTCEHFIHHVAGFPSIYF
jgi:hypothetical protein